MTQQLLDIHMATAHLAMALNLLDGLGAHVSAAHVDAALHSLKQEAMLQPTFGQMLTDPKLDFSYFDVMIDEICDRAASPVRQSATN